MKSLNRILINVLVFFLIFATLNLIFQSCQDDEEELTKDGGNLIFLVSKNEYSRTSKVTVEITNNTDKIIEIKNECPGEPFDVFRYENNEWIQKTSNPELDCSNAKDITLEAGKNMNIPYENWNYALFSEMGRFKINFETELNGELKTISTQEFIVGKEGLFKQITIGLFYRPIYNGLIFITSIIPGHDLGWAIIILTLIIRTILLIPSQKAIKSQKRMQDIQPRLEKIKKKYKGDQQKIAMETMAVWKEAKVNPVGSCLPMLMQFPFLIALFYVVKGGLNPDNSYLFYGEYTSFSLSDIHVIFLGILDLTKKNIYVLPLIIGGLQFFQMKLSLAKKAPNKKDKNKKNEMAIATNMMTYIMPVMIAVFTASLPAGVGIYWGTSTLYGIVQQLVANKGGGEKSKEPKVRVINSKTNNP
ncbi:YidC/Oxa1 family membrane protein insertase [Patescibacteria group bacterium]